jgi:hypothetical protein
MKKIFTICVFVIMLCSLIYGQHRKPGEQGMGALQKIEQLEKAKLIEALSLNEDTAVRFFARRTENQKKIREILNQRETILKELEKSLKSSNQLSDAAYKDQVNNLIALDASIGKERENFYRSLGDLFSPHQIAKLVVFETNFRREIRESLMNKGPRSKN